MTYIEFVNQKYNKYSIYTFSIGSSYPDVFDACRSIYNDNNDILGYCAPNFRHQEEVQSCIETSEMSGDVDNLYWHINNDGTDVQGVEAKSDADADICECWGDGYAGEGIKVAVIDRGGYDYDHPEMEDVFTSGSYFLYNSTDGTIQQGSITEGFLYDGGSGESVLSHGMLVSSAIAANENDGAATSSVGVAYDSKVMPYLTFGWSIEFYYAAIQAVDDGADIINYSSGYQTTKEEVDLTNENEYNPYVLAALYAKENGRNGKGTIVFAAAGNSSTNETMSVPAALTGFVGIGASNPFDNRASFSNYLSSNEEEVYYDFVAPGLYILGAYTNIEDNSAVRYNKTWSGTSVASPIVAGIAAILLSKDESLTRDELYESIKSGTDKPTQNSSGQSIYSYSSSGFNNEMFYGRINCKNSLGLINGLSSSILSESGTSYMSDGLLIISLSKEQDIEQVDLFDLTGKKVMNNIMNT